MAKVRVQGAELNVHESVEEVLSRVANAVQGVRMGGARVTAPGWIVLTDATISNRQLYVQAVQIGYVHEDD
jgi:hypothetical protein